MLKNREFYVVLINTLEMADEQILNFWALKCWSLFLTKYFRTLYLFQQGEGAFRHWTFDQLFVCFFVARSRYVLMAFVSKYYSLLILFSHPTRNAPMRKRRSLEDGIDESIHLELWDGDITYPSSDDQWYVLLLLVFFYYKPL